jgi:hypothetical protein
MLWEALAGRHPFWSVSPLETARRVEQGAQPLGELRPDLPRGLCRSVDRMLAVDPGKRPSAKQAVHLLRSAEEDRGKRTRSTTSPTMLRERAPHALLAAATAAGTAFILPFFPSGWPFLLGALAALLALALPTAGLAFALAVPILPLGNVSLGLALAYTCLAFAWLVLFWRDPRSGLLFTAGPLLGAVHLLPLVPLVALHARGHVRRAATGTAAVLAAAVTAAVAGIRLPLTGEAAPGTGGLGRVTRPDEVVGDALSILAGRPTILAAAVVIAAASVAAPIVRQVGLWAVGAWGAGLFAVLLLVPFAVDGAPVAAHWAVGATILATGALAYPLLGERANPAPWVRGLAPTRR